MTERPLRILQCIETGGPGGAEQVVLTLSRALVALGHSVTALTFREGWLTENLTLSNIPRIQLKTERRLDLTLPLRLKQIIRSHKIDIVHSHLLDTNFYAAIAARFANVRHIATEHGDIHHTTRKSKLRFKLKTQSVLGSQITAVSEFSAEHLSRLGVPLNKISVIGNPIDLPSLGDGELRQEIRKKIFGIEDDSWIWIHVANFRPVKDQQTLLNGYARAAAGSSSNSRLVLVGDGDLRTALEQQVDSLGIRSRVQFLGFRNDVGRLLQGADGFILSSRSEALPMALLEAGSHGLLLVASQVGGIPELIIPGETGHLFPAGDPAALAEILRRAENETTKSTTLRTATQSLIHHRYSVDSILQQYLKLYRAPK